MGADDVIELADLAEDDLTGLAEAEETSYEDPYLGNTKMTWYPYAEDTDMDASPAPADD